MLSELSESQCSLLFSGSGGVCLINNFVDFVTIIAWFAFVSA